MQRRVASSPDASAWSFIHLGGLKASRPRRRYDTRRDVASCSGGLETGFTCILRAI